MRTFDVFLNHTGCSNMQQLRQANTSTLIKANDFLTSIGVKNGTGIGPIVDGDLVPDLPGKLIMEGRFQPSLRGLVSANNAHEVGSYKIYSMVPYSINSFKTGRLLCRRSGLRYP
jgi:hypothetical protein